MGYRSERLGERLLDKVRKFLRLVFVCRPHRLKAYSLRNTDSFKYIYIDLNSELNLMSILKQQI